MSGGVTTLKAISDTEIDALERKETPGIDRSSDVANDMIRGQNATQVGRVKLSAGGTSSTLVNVCTVVTPS